MSAKKPCCNECGTKEKKQFWPSYPWKCKACRAAYQRKLLGIGKMSDRKVRKPRCAHCDTTKKRRFRSYRPWVCIDCDKVLAEERAAA